MDAFKMFLYILFLIILCVGFGKTEIIEPSDRQNYDKIGYVYIDTNVTTLFIIAESDTYPNLANITFKVKTTLVLNHTDFQFLWTIQPILTDRFFYSNGIGTIKQSESETDVVLLSKDNAVAELESQNYVFKIEKILANTNLTRVLIMVNNTQNSVNMHVLPSDYPFGIFEFANNIPNNITISRFAKTSLADTIIIQRKYGTLNRVLVLCDQIEIGNETSSFKTTKFIEFAANEAQKVINFSYAEVNKDIKYPRQFMLKLTMVKLLDTIPYLDEINYYIKDSIDVLPKIGNQSTIYIRVIDDKSIIQFKAESFIVNIDLAYNTSQNLRLNVFRTNKSDLFPNITVEFVTYPMFGLWNLTGETFQSATENIDYKINTTQVNFQMDKTVSEIPITIIQNINSALLSVADSNRSFQIALVNIKNCDSCELGLHRIATIFINTIPAPFKNLLEFNLTSNYEINYSANVSRYTPTVLCFKPLTDRQLIIDYQFIYDNSTVTSSIVDIIVTNLIENRVSLQGSLLFDGSLNQTSSVQCLNVSAVDTNPSRCFTSNYTLNITTRFFPTSPIISIDQYQIQIRNTNCPFVFIPNQIFINNDTIRNISITNANLVLLRNNTDRALVRIPLEFNHSTNLKSLQNVTLNYAITINSNLKTFLTQNTTILPNGTSQITIQNTNATNGISIQFSLINLLSFQYRMLNVNLTIYRDPTYAFAVTSDKQQVQTISFNFLVKQITNTNSCGVLKTNKYLSKIFLINLQRNLYLVFDGELSNTTCIVNLNYNISMYNSTKAQTSIDTYIEPVSDNYFYVFTPIPNSIKQIPIINDVYIDETDMFLITINSLTEMTNGKFLKPLLNSIDDTSMVIRPIPSITNGDAMLKTDLFLQIDNNDFQPSNIILFNFTRNASYSKAEATYQLMLFRFDLNRTDVLYEFSLVLNHGEMSIIQYKNLRDLLVNYKQVNFELYLVGTICFRGSENDEVIYCSKRNDTTLVEPQGVFQLNEMNATIVIDTTRMLSNNTDYMMIDLQIERKYGAKESIDVYYTLTSTNGYTDLYFSESNNESNYVTLKAYEYRKRIILRLNFLYSSVQRDFYLILTKTQLSQCNCSPTFPQMTRDGTFSGSYKISQDSNIAKLTIMPTDNLNNTLAFSRSTLKIPIMANDVDTSSIDVFITVYRLNAVWTNTFVGCDIRSIGLNEYIPSFIVKSQAPFELRTLAEPNTDYQPMNTTISFSMDQITVNLTFKILNQRMSDTKIVFLYLANPQNGTYMTEPNTSGVFSPFIRIEIQKLNTTIKKDSLTVGFTRQFTQFNRTISVNQLQANDLQMDFDLDPSQTITSQFIDELYQLKWTVEIFDVSDSDTTKAIKDLVKCTFLKAENGVWKCENIVNCYINRRKCSFKMFFKDTTQLVNYKFKVQIKPINEIDDLTPLTIQTDSLSDTCFLTFFENFTYTTMIELEKDSIFVVQDKIQSHVYLHVQRSGLLNVTTYVYFQTKEFLEAWLYFLNIKIYSADTNFDFEPLNSVLIFEPYVRKQTIQINLRAASLIDSFSSSSHLNTISIQQLNSNPNLYPRMFQMVLQNCTPNCALTPTRYISNVTIVLESINLWKVFSHIINNETVINLDELRRRTEPLSPSLNPTELDIIVQILRKFITQYAENSTATTNNSIDTARENVMTIFCNLMNPRRTDTNSRIELVSLLEEFMFASLNSNRVCLANSSTITEGVKFKCPSTYFVYGTNRYVSRFNTTVYYKGESYNAEIPLRQVTTGNGAVLCTDVVVIEFVSTNWLGLKDKKSLLNNKVISITTRLNGTSTNTFVQQQFQQQQQPTRPLIIQHLQPQKVQTLKECSIFDPQAFNWNFATCTTDIYAKYVQCTCTHQSIYGIVYRPNTDQTWYGYNYTWLYFVIICKLVAILFACISYFICVSNLKFHAICLIQLFISVACTQLLLLITAALSERIIVEEPNENNASCIGLSLTFHYFILTQFSWIFTIAFSFYTIVSRNVTSTITYKIQIILMGWLSPIGIITVFYFITGFLYSYIYGFSAAFIYTDVHDNRQLCFIKNIWVLFGGLIIPCVLYSFATLVVLVLMYCNYNYWKTFDDVFKNEPNSREICRIIVLWILIGFINLWACLHMRFGLFWLFIMFCIFDILLALYITFVYTFSRHMLATPVKATLANSKDLTDGAQQQKQQRQQKAAAAMGSKSGSDDLKASAGSYGENDIKMNTFTRNHQIDDDSEVVVEEEEEEELECDADDLVVGVDDFVEDEYSETNTISAQSEANTVETKLCMEAKRVSIASELRDLNMLLDYKSNDDFDDDDYQNDQYNDNDDDDDEDLFSLSLADILDINSLNSSLFNDGSEVYQSNNSRIIQPYSVDLDEDSIVALRNSHV